VAPPIADLEASEEAFFDANRLLLRNPSIINVLDGCAITLPCHPAGTLPVGITLAGPAMRDGYLMGVARAVELELQSWGKVQSAA
jgi:Asp-tRNA(Asn)/Glu-tRNA(Gln) amidotransferase A subunit family amidase